MMNAHIEDSETLDKKYTAYKIIVSYCGNEWFVFRRYNEFCTLLDKLKKSYPDNPLKLPGKRLFGNFDTNFIKKRKSGLHTFLQEVLSNDKLMELPEVKTFLGVDKQCFDQADGMEPMDAAPSEESGDADVDLGCTENKKASPSDFEFLTVIGRGSFGKVYLARLKSESKIFAVKVLSKEQIKRRNEVKHIMSERNVLVKNVRHPFLCSLTYSFQTPAKLYFVLDYVNGGELFFHLQKERCFPEPRAKFYAAEMASALGYLHGLHIIYRDLKPENILLDPEGHIVLTDFGLCKEDITSTTSTFCGTPEYLAPEVLKKQPYNYAVDWWCLGSVLYEMLFGLPPFYSRVVSEMYDNILYKPLRLKSNSSLQAQSLLSGLLQKDKNRRLGSRNDFEEIRRHEFFFTINWDDLIARKIEPPFKPNVRSLTDTGNIDPEFTREIVSQSVGKSYDSSRLSASVAEADDSFFGFSYVPPTQDFEDEY